MRDTLLVTLTEGTGGNVGDEVTELVLRGASREVERYVNRVKIREPITDALSTVTADIAVYLLFRRWVQFGTITKSTTTGADETETVTAGETVTATENVVDGQVITTSYSTGTQPNTVSSSVTEKDTPNAGDTTVTNTTTPASMYNASATDTETTNDTTVNNDQTVNVTANRSQSVTDNITEIPKTVIDAYNEAVRILKDRGYLPMLLGYTERVAVRTRAYREPILRTGRSIFQRL